MKIYIFLFLFLVQTKLFSQELYGTSVLWENDSTKIEMQYWKKMQNYYQKILLHQSIKIEEIITIGLDSTNFAGFGYKGSYFDSNTTFIEKIGGKNRKNQIFYNDSTFSFAATKVKERLLVVVLIQCKKQNGVWKVNKMVEWPTRLSLTAHCNVFFLSEDIACLDVWGREAAGDRLYPYIVILGENNTYTKFVQEGKEYPPERPLYITPPNGNPSENLKEK